MTLALIAAFAVGALLGAAHFGSLWWSVVLMRHGRTILGAAAQALRFAGLALALALIARQGAVPCSLRRSASSPPARFSCAAIGGSREVAAEP